MLASSLLYMSLVQWLTYINKNEKKILSYFSFINSRYPIYLTIKCITLRPTQDTLPWPPKHSCLYLTPWLKTRKKRDNKIIIEKEKTWSNWHIPDCSASSSDCDPPAGGPERRIVWSLCSRQESSDLLRDSVGLNGGRPGLRGGQGRERREGRRGVEKREGGGGGGSEEAWERERVCEGNKEENGVREKKGER